MNFQVQPFSNKEYILIQLTDTHLLEAPEHDFMGINPETSFHQVIDHIKFHYPHAEAIIHTGDLAQTPTPKTYQRYIKFMQTLGIPFFQTLGNHDDEQYFPLHGEHSQQPTLIHLGNWRIILLNSAVNNQIHGFISEQQQEQLIKLLESHQEHPTLLACHHHFFDMDSPWIDQHKLINSEDIFRKLNPFKQVKAILYGHVHQSSHSSWQHIECLSTPSTCIQFKPFSKDFTLGSVASGYRIIRLKPCGKFKSQIHYVE